MSGNCRRGRKLLPSLHYANQLISRHVITGFPAQRLAYLSERIRSVNAQYCAVLEPGTFAVLGLVRFSEVMANPATAMRIFSDLMQPPPSAVIHDFTPVEQFLDLLREDPAEIVVTRESGEFAGLITPESFFQWLLSIPPPIPLALENIPTGSRWYPYPTGNAERSESVA